MKITFQTKCGRLICKAQHRTYQTIKRAVWLAIEKGAETLEAIDERGQQMDLTDILQARKLTL